MLTRNTRGSCGWETTPGGALNFDDGTKVEGMGAWRKINGHVYHWNDSREGSIYSIALYRRTRQPKSSGLQAALRAKREQGRQSKTQD